MKTISAELKRTARENLNRRYGLPIGASLVAGLITSALLMPFSFILDPYKSVSQFVTYELVSFLITLLSVILSAGLTRIHLKLFRQETPLFSDLFYAFTIRPDRFILGTLLLSVISAVCMIPAGICFTLWFFNHALLLLVFGSLLGAAAAVLLIIISLKFSLVFILLTEEPSMGVIEAFRTSSELMNGNKGRLFYLQLSFIGLTLLGILSFGIGFLWLEPYMQQTTVVFYQELKNAK